MKKRKIRGHTRRQKKIQEWAENDSNFPLDLLEKYKYWYSDIYVHPWCDISIIESEFPEPKGKTRDLLILGLEKIYNSWKIELEKLGKPYYLKIWLFEPRVSKSQVVCAIDNKIDYYSNLFHKVEDKRRHSDFYNKLSPKLKWKSFEDAEVFSEEDLSAPIELYDFEKHYWGNIKLLNKLKKGNYRSEMITDEKSNDKLYFLPKGKVWVSED